MTKVLLALVCCALGGSVAGAAATAGSTNTVEPGDALARETRHFLECLAFVYGPEMWVSYQDSLYFTAMTEDQAKQLEAMRKARSGYSALTDRQKRHEITAKAISASGVGPLWQAKLLLPFSETNQNLTPTLDRPVRILPSYKLLQKLGNGDALIQDHTGAVYFVMNFGRAVDDAGCTNGLFLREGEKTYTTVGGGKNTVEAVTSVGLNAAEKSALARVSAEFKREATPQKPAVIPAQDRQEFELLKARATDSNPYFQFLVAKAYFDGKGTQKDEDLGLEWMRRAGANGSGDAKTFLEKQKEAK